MRHVLIRLRHFLTASDRCEVCLRPAEADRFCSPDCKDEWRSAHQPVGVR
jgi:hypothetical protein